MNNKTYYASIDIKAPIIAVINRIIDMYKILYPDVIFSDIFVSEYVKKDGERVYESLYLFTDTCIYEAKKFVQVNQQDLDITVMKESIVYYNIKSTNYDYAVCSEESKLSVDVTFDNKMHAILKASGSNCGKLIEITRTYLINNFTKLCS